MRTYRAFVPRHAGRHCIRRSELMTDANESCGRRFDLVEEAESGGWRPTAARSAVVVRAILRIHLTAGLILLQSSSISLCSFLCRLRLPACPS